ncbi:MAG TPA: hypothetical protein VNA13_05055 [Xanthomonadales bacterium]|nr:hypothetical protein [Xanthomonadales bacterium]
MTPEVRSQLPVTEIRFSRKTKRRSGVAAGVFLTTAVALFSLRGGGNSPDQSNPKPLSPGCSAEPSLVFPTKQGVEVDIFPCGDGRLLLTKFPTKLDSSGHPVANRKVKGPYFTIPLSSIEQKAEQNVGEGCKVSFVVQAGVVQEATYSCDSGAPGSGTTAREFT